MEDKRNGLRDNTHPAMHLYKQQAPAILAFLYKQTASWEDAEDILVEIFTVSLEQRYFSTLNETEQLKWLWKVAHNKVADHFRRFKRHPDLPLDLEIIEAVYEDNNLTPEQSFLRKEEYSDLHAMLRTLPETQQTLLKLRFGHDLSSAQIGLVLNKTEGTVRVLLSRTLKHLRDIYQHIER
jgi:RNA polymerase sigma factor (sigma-70 family)